MLKAAAAYDRIDVCRLLIEYGVKPDFSKSSWSPLQLAMSNFSPPNRLFKKIDIFRLLIADVPLSEDFQCANWSFIYYFTGSVDDMLWLWQQSEHVLFGQDLIDFRKVLARYFFVYFVREHSVERRETFFQLWAKLIWGEFMDEIAGGQLRLLQIVCGAYRTSHDNPMDSYIEGSALILALSRLGVDYQTCITRELEALENKVLKTKSYALPDRRIKFEQNEGGDWTLEWEWAYESDESKNLIYTLHSQFDALTLPWVFWEWPFRDPYYIIGSSEVANRASRFKRRMAAKCRKEKARTGKKQSRGKMPGSWVD
ncbi:hypothetical protein GQ44DRAFT_58281 [Phaeosphaeriaceae sp. PMI808]|nr:hypothetical protein GQ44DRAFT_58281 [Phaeosphaeriaceae sp. PMI808]